MDNLFFLEPGQTCWYPVLSGSMAPVFLPGDEICIRKVDADSSETRLHGGMCVVFFREGKFQIHRILVSLPCFGAYYEKGDSMEKGRWIRARRIVGVAIAHRRPCGDSFTGIDLKEIPRIRALCMFLSIYLLIPPYKCIKRLVTACIAIFSR